MIDLQPKQMLMKKIFFAFSAILFSAMLLVSCSKNDPKAVAKEWLTDFYHQDYENAKKISTDDTKAMLTTIQSFTGAFPDSIKTKAKSTVITIKDCKIEGDKATVTYVASVEPDKTDDLHLVKQNEKWLVQFSKSEPGNDKSAGQGATLTTDTPPAAPATPDSTSSAMPPDTAATR